MKRLFALAMSLGLVAAVAAPALAAPAEKVNVCHVDEYGVARLINISENAFDSHVAHGDNSPGQIVPSSGGMKRFDADCNILDLVARIYGDGTLTNGDKDITLEIYAWKWSDDSVTGYNYKKVVDQGTTVKEYYGRADAFVWTNDERYAEVCGTVTDNKVGSQGPIFGEAMDVEADQSRENPSLVDCDSDIYMGGDDPTPVWPGQSGGSTPINYVLNVY